MIPVGARWMIRLDIPCIVQAVSSVYFTNNIVAIAVSDNVQSMRVKVRDLSTSVTERQFVLVSSEETNKRTWDTIAFAVSPSGQGNLYPYTGPVSELLSPMQNSRTPQ